MSEVAGLLLAAGAGRRYGGLKALARDAEGTWLTRVASTLTEAGLEVLAVLPSAHPETVELLPSAARSQFVDTVDEGIGASLRAGLTALLETPAPATLITLVDLPALPTSVVHRVLAYRIKESSPEIESDPHGRVTVSAHLLDSVRGGRERVLRRAVFDGRPGHPVLIGRAHWPELIRTAGGDVGAGPYLRAHGAEEVECGDLWDGRDIDHP